MKETIFTKFYILTVVFLVYQSEMMPRDVYQASLLLSTFHNITTILCTNFIGKWMLCYAHREHKFV